MVTFRTAPARSSSRSLLFKLFSRCFPFVLIVITPSVQTGDGELAMHSETEQSQLSQHLLLAST